MARSATAVLNTVTAPARRIVAGHPRVFASLVFGVAVAELLPRHYALHTRVVLAWDAGVLCFLGLCAVLFRAEPGPRMAREAAAQQEGEWTIFWTTIAAVAFSFAVIVLEFSGIKDLSPAARSIRVGLVALTLTLSWLATHTLFALRYAHEYYEYSPGAAEVDGGLAFPGDATPDYWDFLYFSLVLGMTFQVSDVQITSRKLRRLAALHGLLSFLFNTIILALTVNLAAGLL